MDHASPSADGKVHNPGVTEPDDDDTTIPFIFGMSGDKSDAIALTDAPATNIVRSSKNNFLIVIIIMFYMMPTQKRYCQQRHQGFNLMVTKVQHIGEIQGIKA